MNGRWWGGSGISIAFHAALLLVLIYAAARPSQLDATPSVPSRPTKFIVTVGAIGLGPIGGGGDGSTAPRTARVPQARPLDIVTPQAMTLVEPIPVGVVPMIAMQDVERLPGASYPVDGTALGNGSGPGGGGGHGPGNGPGDGPGVAEVYDAGVGGVSAPRLIYEVKPNFTVDAMRAKIQGVVLMDVIVLPDGSVDARIRITRSLDPGLDLQAMIAVRQWRFRPAIRLGQPVASRVTIELAFTLR